MVSRLVRGEEFAGSTPVTLTKARRYEFDSRWVHLRAHSSRVEVLALMGISSVVEQTLDKREIVGPTPTSPTSLYGGYGVKVAWLAVNQ